VNSKPPPPDHVRGEPSSPRAPIVPLPQLRKWRRVRDEAAGSYSVFEVHRIELEDARGQGRGHAFTIRGNDWCNIIALTPNDEVVLVWQYRFGSDAISLEIPGGVIDTGEAPERAALRELREETGYEADRAELLLVVEPNPAMQSNRCYTFVARGARPTATTRLDPMEEIETALLPSARVADLLDSGQVTHALVQGALEAFCRRRLPLVP
jgi:8-oxo-dGTP pyrophosphatase MutT (NUDIX family)